MSISQDCDLMRSNFLSCEFHANGLCDFDFIWFVTPNKAIFMHHNDFNIGKATDSMGTTRQPSQFRCARDEEECDALRHIKFKAAL
jgi:hypothetical protein